MKISIIRTWLILTLAGLPSPVIAQAKQVNVSVEKPWLLSDGIVGAIATSLLAGAGWAGMAIGKQLGKVKEMELKQDIMCNVGVVVDTKIADREKIKGLELENMLIKIQNSIDGLSEEVHNMNRNQESYKELINRRFGVVEKEVSKQQKNMDSVVHRLSQTLDATSSQYGVKVNHIGVRSGNSNPFNYDTDGGNVDA